MYVADATINGEVKYIDSFLKVLRIAMVIFYGKEVWEELAWSNGIGYCTFINSKSLVEMKWHYVHLFGFLI